MEDKDEEYDELEHDRLISAVSKLDKSQHIKQPSRNEPTNQSSEFNLVKRSKNLNINNVAKILENTATHVKISKKLKKTQDIKKVLPKPLEKPQAERIKRATGYEESKKKLGRWDPVVARSRTVDYVSFPLKHFEHKLQPTSEFISKFKSKSPLELELDEVDPPPEVEDEDEEDQVYPMSYQEMIEHRQHLAKMRAQQSFREAKHKRQNKIKSKKYHRILKKERLKQQIKEFEDLQQTDPEEALKRLEILEKNRAKERHTLRHRNTGKWAKNLQVRAKYDKEVRAQLAEQLAVSRGLTAKIQNDSSDEDDEVNESETIPDITLSKDPNNPWMLNQGGKTNVDAEFDFGYKKYVKDRLYKNKSDSDTESEPEKTNSEPNAALEPIQCNIDSLLLQNNAILAEEKLSDLNFKKKKSKIVENIVKLQKNETSADLNEKNKLENKSKLVSTSNWTVETVIGGKSCNIVEAFDSLESTTADKVQKKLDELKRTLNHLENAPKNKQRNVKNKNESDSLEYFGFKNKKKAIIDQQLNEDSKEPDVDESENAAKILANTPSETSDNIDTNIDPNKFIKATPTYLNTAISGDNNFDELDDEEQVVPKVNIEDVFEEDDVVASFRQEKESEANESQPKDIDLSLPGWGAWGGKGVKPPRKRKNRFILKAPPKVPRRDDNKGDVIIREYKDPKLSSHKIDEVPFPFTSIKEFEASIRAPLGNTFIPEKAHKKLIKPSVITRAGTIIEPMDEEELIVKKNRSFANKNIIKMLGNKK